ncbi:MAG: DUF2487 family protein [Candidatus Cohnella colombiensis]|uniref:DUF2487 family protein n=1 Tax=Candidatus Cohnella colombiensis TaxID=3121368 RepID=A0AA95F681_9BACL|nr:MAG: DUF2487 family protein [Cohnella sp.]
MKFSELNEASWLELQHYLDTCLLPVSGLRGDETPWEATDKIARTGQWLAPIETSFHGRTVTLPAYHYDLSDEGDVTRLNNLCSKLRNTGFAYIIVVCGQPEYLSNEIVADLLVQPMVLDEQPDVDSIRSQIAMLWRKPAVTQ